jgi:hypothetical protein
MNPIAKNNNKTYQYFRELLKPTINDISTVKARMTISLIISITIRN